MAVHIHQNMEAVFSGIKDFFITNPKYVADNYNCNKQYKKSNGEMTDGLVGMRHHLHKNGKNNKSLKEAMEAFNCTMKSKEEIMDDSKATHGHGGGQGRNMRRAIMIVLVIVLVALLVMIAMPSCINNNRSPFEDFEALFNCGQKICPCSETN